MAGPCHVPMRSAVGAGPIIHANAMTKCVRRLYRYLMAGKRLQGGHQDSFILLYCIAGLRGRMATGSLKRGAVHFGGGGVGYSVSDLG